MKHARTLVYVAGPFSGDTRKDVERNIDAAESLGLRVAQVGAYPVISHCNTGHPAFEYLQAYRFWIEATAELLLRCDAVIFVPGWEASKGATNEYLLAKRQGIPCFFELSDLVAWLERDRLCELGVWPVDTQRTPRVINESEVS